MIEDRKERNKKYYEATKEKRRLEYEANKDILIQKNKEYRENNKDKIKATKKVYYKANKDKINLYFKNRKQKDIIFKLKCNLRTSIANLLKRKNLKKVSQTEIILGCNFECFKEHLEKQFADWMTWDNYGLYNGTPNFGWDIDHIIPNTNGIDIYEVLKLNHYTNLQPLCSYINREVKRGG